MSVDISRLSASLSPEQQKAVARVYRQRAKDPTTAFLLCFFLGIFGAHCFYLGKTGQGVFRLIISPLIVPGLIWEIVDLFRIDGEVYERNLKLGEQLVAEAMLAAPPAAAEQEAIRRLDQVIQEQEQERAGAAAVATSATAETLAATAAPEETPAAHVAAAYDPATASSDTSGEPERPGAAAAPEVPVWPVEAAVAAAAAATALAADQAAAGEQQRAAEERPTAPWPEQAYQPMAPALENAEPAPAAPPWPAPETASWATQPADATATQQAPADWGQAEASGAAEGAGSPAGGSASQTPGSADEEPAEPAYPWPEARPLMPEPSESGPLWAQPPALMAEAGLATAAALDAADMGAASAESAAPQPATFESTMPEQASSASAWQTSPGADLPYQQPTQSERVAAEAPSETYATEPGPDDTWSTITPEAVAAAALLANQVAPLRRAPIADVTDQAADVGEPGYVADVGEGGPARRVHVTVPADQPLADSYAFDAAQPRDLPAQEFVAAPSAATETQPVAPGPEEGPAGEQGTGDVSSATLLLVPVAEAATEPAAVADTTGTTGVAGEAPAGEPQGPAEPPAGDYESHVTEEVHDQGGQGGRRVVKRVRVVRRLMVNGQVVQETSAEQVVDAGADTAATAASLQQALGNTDPETLARLAGTLPDNYVVRQGDQTEGSGGPASPGQTGSGGAGQGGA